MSAPAPKRVLITGASIAGPVAAYWLARSRYPSGAPKFHVTILERAPSLRTNGAGVDVRGPGLEILQKMDLEKEIRSKTSHEEGMKFVDDKGRARASFPVGHGEFYTSDIEITRGDVAVPIVRKAEEVGVKFLYGDEISAVEETEKDKVKVTYAHSNETQEFDVLIVAEGLFSHTRDLVFGVKTSANSINCLGAYIAWFTIPREDYDDDWCHCYNTAGGRHLLIRPDLDQKRMRAGMQVVSSERAFEHVIRACPDTQKDLFREHFQDAGWEAQRVIKGMEASDDFYMQKLAQVKLPSWTKGRVALVGDAAWCPSLFTGMGTSSALVGGYILAKELEHCPEDPHGAFVRYEKEMRPFIEKAQELPPGAPWAFNPQSAWGVECLRSVASIMSWTPVFKLILAVSKMSKGLEAVVELPQYID